MSANLSGDDKLLDLKRRAYVLDRISITKGGKLTASVAIKKVPKQIAAELAMSEEVAVRLHVAMVSEDLLAFAKRNYWITDSGREWLEAHRDHLPAKTMPKPKGETKAKRVPKAKPVPKPKPIPPVAIDVPVPESRDAFLLLAVFDASEGGRTLKDLCKKAKTSPPTLSLDEVTTGRLLDDLISRLFVVAHRATRSIKHTITPAGQSHLLTLSFDGLGNLPLTGPSLTKLVSALREKEPRTTLQANESNAEAAGVPTSAQLEAAVMDIFAELRRERHANTGLVPIHEVRSSIRQRHGETAASHAVLDDVLKGLRRSKKLGLLSISDRSRATPEQLQDSIVGVGETFFYLERVDGPATG